MTTVRDALNVELADISQGDLSINQEYRIYGLNTRVNSPQTYMDTQTDPSIYVGMDPGPHFVHPSEFNDTRSGFGAPNIEIVFKQAHGSFGSSAPLTDCDH